MLSVAKQVSLTILSTVWIFDPVVKDKGVVVSLDGKYGDYSLIEWYVRLVFISKNVWRFYFICSIARFVISASNNPKRLLMCSRCIV